MAEQYLRIVAPLNGGTNRCAKRDTAVLTGRVAEAGYAFASRHHSESTLATVTDVNMRAAT